MSGSLISWIDILRSSHHLGNIFFVILLVGLVVFAVRLIRSFSETACSVEGLLWGWVLFYFFYHVFNIHSHRYRYLLPILPFAILLVSLTLDRILDFLTRRGHFSRSRAQTITIIVLVISLPFFSKAWEYRDRVSNFEESPRFIAGKWLSGNIPHNYKVLSDFYTYIPTEFSDAFLAFKPDINLLRKNSPDIVVINRTLASVYCDWDNFERGPTLPVYDPILDYYRSLIKEELGYRLLRDFKDVKIFIRSDLVK